VAARFDHGGCTSFRERAAVTPACYADGFLAARGKARFRLSRLRGIITAKPCDQYRDFDDILKMDRFVPSFQFEMSAQIVPR
jgi:hypothetical protein